MKKDRKNEIWGVLFLLVGLFTLVSLLGFNQGDMAYYTSHPAKPVANYTGIIGAYLSFGLFLTFGFSAYVIPFIFLLWAGCYFLQKVPEKKMFKLFGLVIALFSTSTIITICVEPSLRLEQGGVIGYLVGSHLLQYFGFMGSFILAASCFLLSVLLATDFLIYPIIESGLKNSAVLFKIIYDFIEQVREWAEEKIAERAEAKAQEEPALKNKKQEKRQGKQVADIAPKTLPEMPLKVKRYRGIPEEEEVAEEVLSKKEKPAVEAPAKPVQKPLISLSKQKAANEEKAEQEEKNFDGVVGSEISEEDAFILPSTELLKMPEKGFVNSDNLQENSRIMESTLAEFGIEVKVTEVEQGPVITRYELLPAPGVKVNSISALSDDLALALKAKSIRLIIPIPGKSAVGVEVPNSVSATVYAKELIDDPKFKSKKYVLPLALGKDTSGKTLVSDLTTMPHMLIAGTTGSGKTVCVNAIILGLLSVCKPSELKFLMIDPKMVELAVYNKIPHMLSPVVTDPKKAAHTLNWAINEMERRYKLLAAVGVRNILSFNEREISEEDLAELEGKEDSDNVVPAKLPYIVVIVDELADLMMIARDKVETSIARLAQLSRAVGIHLILATQRPSVDVITGVIKANFPARVSFKVASKVDSRTVLDAMGADKLLGRGDMLFMRPGEEKPIRGQAPLVVDSEINAVVAHLKRQAEPDYHDEIQNAQAGKTAGGAATEKDELFDEAVSIVLETGQASTSNLQRRLRLGYTRAARIIDQMEAEGLIGPANGAKGREIFISREEETLVEEDEMDPLSVPEESEEAIEIE